MVRIRSDRWYSGENQKKIRRGAPSNSSGTRRVLSLIFLLVLVMLLMQKVSNPQNVSNAFRSLGMPIDQPIVDASHPELKSISSTKLGQEIGKDKSEPPPASTGSSASQVDSAWEKTCADLIPRVLEAATPEQIQQLSLYLFSNDGSQSRSSNSTMNGLEIQMILQPLQAKLDLAQENDKRWNERLIRFQNQWELLIGLSNAEVDQLSDANKLDQQFQKMLSENLDKKLLGSLRDAAPWVGGETVGFGRLLQRSREFASANKNLPQVSSRQLDTEFAKLRGQWVSFRGTVRLVETVKRPQPLLDQSVYYVLWLRGQDQSAQPIAVYTAQSIAEKFAKQVSVEQFPEVEVTAIVGKKLAYGSAAGVQVTPTLFADAIVQFATTQPSVQTEVPKVTRTQWTLGVLVGFVGLVFFVASIWKQLRRKKRLASTVTLVLVASLFVQSASTTVLACLPQADVSQSNLSQSSNSSTQDPPWSKASDVAGQLTQIVQQRLQPIFTPELQLQLAETMDGRSNAAPDFVLRSIFAIKQAGWKQLWSSGSSIRLNDQFELAATELEGTVRVVQALNLSEIQQEWFSVQPTRCIYRLQVELNSANLTGSTSQSSPQLVSIFCTHVPSIWKSSAQLKQPVQLRSFKLIKKSIDNASASQSSSQVSETICHIADRLAWRVDTIDEGSLQTLMPKLPDSWAQLGKQGWDLAWFDLLAENNKRVISGDEADALRSMLSITANESNSKLSSSEAAPSLQLVQALQDTASHIGEKVDWTVRLVSARQVDLDGKQSYFQLDGFARMLPGQVIKFDSGIGEGKAVDFKGEFPVTILSKAQPDLLQGKQAVSVGDGTWKVGLLVQVQGRFFRLWSYESERVKTSTGNGRLVAPLVMASSVTETRNPPVMNRSGGWWIYLVAMFLVIVASSFIQIRLRGRSKRSKPR